MVFLSPVGLAAAPVANQLSTMVTFKEKLCIPYCNNTNIATQIGVSYTTGTPILVGTTVFVPVTANVSVLSPSKCCLQNPQGCTENFFVAFQGRTALPASVTITSVGRTFEPTCIDNNGRVNDVAIYDSITVTLA